jgi:hypothetical protein
MTGARDYSLNIGTTKGPGKMSDFTTLMLSPQMSDLHKLVDTLPDTDKGIIANAIFLAYQTGFTNGRNEQP